jgi:hypothetical protein
MYQIRRKSQYWTGKGWTKDRGRAFPAATKRGPEITEAEFDDLALRRFRYWTGNEWTVDSSQAAVYDFASQAIDDFPPEYAVDCVAVGLTSDQWAALPASTKYRSRKAANH